MNGGLFQEQPLRLRSLIWENGVKVILTGRSLRARDPTELRTKRPFA